MPPGARSAGTALRFAGRVGIGRMECMISHARDGRRCPARTGLEFDRVLEVARGGEASVQNVRLRCRAHNQLEAERRFGAEFMHRKRMAAAEAPDGKARAPAAGAHAA